MNLSLVIALLLCLLGGLPVVASPSSTTKHYKGWILFQESSNGGPIDFTVTDQAIRIDVSSCRFYAIAKAPDWNVWIVRPETKEMGFVKLAQWQQFNTSTVGATNDCTLDKPISKKSITVKGIDLPSYQYLFPGEKITAAIYQTEKLREVTNYFVDSYQLSKAPQVAAIQCQLYSCTNLDGLLINCTGKLKETSDIRWFIRTKTLQRSDSIPASMFALPTNYKMLKTIDSRFKFKNMAGDLDAFGEMLDLGKANQRKQPKL